MQLLLQVPRLCSVAYSTQTSLSCQSVASGNCKPTSSIYSSAAGKTVKTKSAAATTRFTPTYLNPSEVPRNRTRLPAALGLVRQTFSGFDIVENRCLTRQRRTTSTHFFPSSPRQLFRREAVNAVRNFTHCKIQHDLRGHFWKLRSSIIKK